MDWLSSSPAARGSGVGITRQRGVSLDASNQEFPQGDINVDIVEFVIEGGLHVDRAYEARRGVVLPSHTPQFLAFGEGQLQPAVTTGDTAFDLDLSGHFSNITTTILVEARILQCRSGLLQLTLWGIPKGPNRHEQGAEHRSRCSGLSCTQYIPRKEELDLGLHI